MLSGEFLWLVRLRWIAVIGQLLVVFSVSRMLTAPLVFPSLLGIISIITLSNLIVPSLTKNSNKRIMGEVLLLDISALTAMLYLSGGASNPFGFFYIVHVALAAILLGEVWTWAIALLTSFCYGLLFFFSIEISALSHNHHQHGSESFDLHLQGMWLGFTLLSGVLAFFFTRIIRELKSKEATLRQVEARAFRNERLASVTSLAANAAHELNTPLSSIKLAAEGILSAIGQGASAQTIKGDANLISDEVVKCSRILEDLRKSAGEVEGQVPEEILFEDLIDEVRSKLSIADSLLNIDEASRDLSLRVPRRPIIEALAALTKNALESCKTPVVEIKALRSSIQQSIIIKDNGEGIPDEVAPFVGEPFYTTKAGKGMGLGVFLARSFIEQLGGTLKLSSSKGQGTTALLEFPA